MARIASVLGAVAILACASAYATPSAPAAAPSGSSSGSGSSGNTPWKPVVGVREVNAFNLLSSSSVFGKIIRAGCTGSSKSSFGQYGCPNLGIVEMDSIAIGNEEQQADLVAMVVATSALPAAVMAYFEIGSNFNLTDVHCTSTDCNEVTQKLQHNEYNKVLSVTASAFASTVAFQSIVEFEDLNGNGVYDHQTDLLVSDYDFLTPSPAEQPLWGPMNLETRDLGNGVSARVLNITTQDGVFSLEYAVSDSDNDPSTARTEISVQIKNFPYQSTTGASRLALMTYLGAAKAGASITANGKGAKVSSTSSDAQVILTSGGLSGYYGWVETATATLTSGLTRSVRVLSSGWRDIGSVEEEGLKLSIASIALLGNTGGTGDVALQAAYFSFDAERPEYIYWDPELVFGGVTQIPEGTGLAVVLVTVAGCLAVLMFGLGMAFLSRRRKLTNLKFPPLMQALKQPSEFAHQGDACYDDDDDADARTDDTYISPLTREGSIYVPAEQVAACAVAVRAPAALVTCQLCRFTGVYGEGFCSSCGTMLHDA